MWGGGGREPSPCCVTDCWVIWTDIFPYPRSGQGQRQDRSLEGQREGGGGKGAEGGERRSGGVSVIGTVIASMVEAVVIW